MVQHDPPPDMGLTSKQIDSLPMMRFDPALVQYGGSVEASPHATSAAMLVPPASPQRQATSIDMGDLDVPAVRMIPLPAALSAGVKLLRADSSARKMACLRPALSSIFRAHRAVTCGA